MSLTRPDDNKSTAPTLHSQDIRRAPTTSPPAAGRGSLYSAALLLCLGLGTPHGATEGCRVGGGGVRKGDPKSSATHIGIEAIPWLPADEQSSALDRNAGWIMRVPDSLGPGPLDSSALGPSEGVRTARAFQFDAPIFASPDETRKIIGVVRRNLEVQVLGPARGPGCERGWLSIVGDGFICATDGFDTSLAPPPLKVELRSVAPDLNRALPFAYGQILRDGTPIFRSLPSQRELALAREPRPRGKVDTLIEHAQGNWLVAIDRRVEGEAGSFLRTVRGHYLASADVTHSAASPLYGEEFDPSGLPIAFVHDPDTPVYDVRDGQQTGTADRYYRFPVVELLTLGSDAGEHAGLRVARGPGDFSMPLTALRMALPIRKPAGIPDERKWIHINLAEQTLIAYEGSIPKWTALISTGAGDFATPEGLFRIDKKYISHTMRGTPDEGSFRVGQVPWVLYYWDSFAMHGAFWHDEFGQPASHGCTNLSPLDARWLFFWAEPKLEPGWHGRDHAEGTWVYLSHFPAATRPDAVQRAHSVIAAR